MKYLDQFIEAVKFLEEFDEQHKLAKIDYAEMKRSIEEEWMANLELNKFLKDNVDVMASGFISNSTTEFANACHSTTQAFHDNWTQQEIFKHIWVATTIGDIKFNGSNVYNTTKGSIKKVMADGFKPNQDLGLHVWLTFPNMWVLDLTIVPTLIKNGIATAADFDGKNYIVWKPSTASNLVYEPILHHDTFMYQVDQIKGYA